MFFPTRLRCIPLSACDSVAICLVVQPLVCSFSGRSHRCLSSSGGAQVHKLPHEVASPGAAFLPSLSSFLVGRASPFWSLTRSWALSALLRRALLTVARGQSSGRQREEKRGRECPITLGTTAPDGKGHFLPQNLMLFCAPIAAANAEVSETARMPRAGAWGTERTKNQQRNCPLRLNWGTFPLLEPELGCLELQLPAPVAWSVCGTPAGQHRVEAGDAGGGGMANCRNLSYSCF